MSKVQVRDTRIGAVTAAENSFRVYDAVVTDIDPYAVARQTGPSAWEWETRDFAAVRAALQRLVHNIAGIRITEAPSAGNKLIRVRREYLVKAVQEYTVEVPADLDVEEWRDADPSAFDEHVCDAGPSESPRVRRRQRRPTRCPGRELMHARGNSREVAPAVRLTVSHVEDHEGNGDCRECGRKGLRWIVVLSDGSRVGAECANKLLGWKLDVKTTAWIEHFRLVATHIEDHGTAKTVWGLWEHKQNPNSTRQTRDGLLVSIGGARSQWENNGWTCARRESRRHAQVRDGTSEACG